MKKLACPDARDSNADQMGAGASVVSAHTEGFAKVGSVSNTACLIAQGRNVATMVAMASAEHAMTTSIAPQTLLAF